MSLSTSNGHTKDGTLFLLQARSITGQPASFSWTAAQLGAREQHPDRRAVSAVLERQHQRGAAWVRDAAVLGSHWASDRACLPSPTRGARSHRFRTEDEPSVLGFFFHRPYVNVSLLLEAARRTPG